ISVAIVSGSSVGEPSVGWLQNAQHTRRLIPHKIRCPTRGWRQISCWSSLGDKGGACFLAPQGEDTTMDYEALLRRAGGGDVRACVELTKALPAIRVRFGGRPGAGFPASRGRRSGRLCGGMVSASVFARSSASAG